MTDEPLHLISVPLTAEQHQSLDRLARRRGASMEELVREALDDYLAEEAETREQLAVAAWAARHAGDDFHQHPDDGAFELADEEDEEG